MNSTTNTYKRLIEEFPFQVWDFSEDHAYFFRTFEQALWNMRPRYDAKITRLSDDVVLAQTYTGELS